MLLSEKLPKKRLLTWLGCNKYVLLANKAGQTLFRIGEGSRIPDVLIKSVNEAFSKDKNIEMELMIQDRIYSLFIVPIKGKEYANIYGLDITDTS